MYIILAFMKIPLLYKIKKMETIELKTLEEAVTWFNKKYHQSLDFFSVVSQDDLNNCWTGKRDSKTKKIIWNRVPAP